MLSRLFLQLFELNSDIQSKTGMDTQIVTILETDLNDYMDNGVYYFSASYTPTNIPAGSNGWLVVFNSSGACKQTWYRVGTVNSNDYETYIRTFASGSWSEWVRMITNADIQSGLASTTSVANGSKEFSVTFPRAFSSLPNVVVVASTSRPDLRSASVASRTTTGFTGAVLNNENSTGTVNVFWIAVASGM